MKVLNISSLIISIMSLNCTHVYIHTRNTQIFLRILKNLSIKKTPKRFSHA